MSLAVAASKKWSTIARMTAVGSARLIRRCARTSARIASGSAMSPRIAVTPGPCRRARACATTIGSASTYTTRQSGCTAWAIS